MTDSRWRLTRRRFLELSGAAAVATSLPVVGCGGNGQGGGSSQRRFFTGAEREALEAAGELILPSGTGMGARENNAIGYLENLLTAFDVDPPEIFAGGPFSGRWPYADPQTGAVTKQYPANDFRTFLPLTRVQELSFRAQIFGSAAVPEIARNDAKAGVHLGWQAIYRDGAAKLDAGAAAKGAQRFSALSVDDQLAVLDSLANDGTVNPRTGLTFPDQLTIHVLEGIFGDPTYGGNRRGQAWAAAGFEGDSQPLGYTQYAEADESFHERPDSPMSKPDPGDVAADGTLIPKTLPDDIQAFIKTMIIPHPL